MINSKIFEDNTQKKEKEIEKKTTTRLISKTNGPTQRYNPAQGLCFSCTPHKTPTHIAEPKEKQTDEDIL